MTKLTVIGFQLDLLLRQMVQPGGGFHSSEGGRFTVHLKWNRLFTALFNASKPFREVSDRQSLVFLLASVLLSACSLSVVEVVPVVVQVTATPVPYIPSPEPYDRQQASDEIPDGFISYIFQRDDNLRLISDKFDVSPQTVLFSNWEVFSQMAYPIGETILIPPEDGELYRWSRSDKLDEVASRFGVRPEDIVAWDGNDLDYAAYVRGDRIEIAPGRYVFIPGGRRPLVPYEAKDLPWQEGPATETP